MADGKRAGVSCDQLPNGRYRLRWRETEREDGIERRVQRSFVVSTEAEATLARARILRAMERGELFEREPVREVAKVATLDSVLAGWVRSRRAKGISPSTYDSHIDAVGRILRTLRALHNIDEGRAVPGELLTRDNVAALTNHLRDQGTPGGDGGLSDGSLYTTMRALVNAWVWASDDPETYPGLRAAPRDTSDLLPRTAIYAPTEAPSMAEVDAMIRRLAPYRRGATAQAVAVIARCTGLRMGQVMGIAGSDVSLSARTLVVSVGKSRREKSERRTVPLAPVLVDYLAPLVEAAGEGALIPRRADFGRFKGEQGRHGAGGPDITLRKAWQAATDAGEARLEVWAPSNRSNPRPGHALRAAFQAHLIEAGVRDEVVDLLVGHTASLRTRHYVSATSRMEAMREAVALVPEIDWSGPGQGAEGNVVELPRRG